MKKTKMLSIIALVTMLLTLILPTTAAAATSETVPTLTWEVNEAKQSIGTTNAILAFTCTLHGASAADVTEVHFAIYECSTNSLLAEKIEAVSFGDYNDFEFWIDVNSELNYTLIPGVRYYYSVSAIVNGEKCGWERFYFTTNGTHEHVPRDESYIEILKEATCGKEGLCEYCCMHCGERIEKSIPKLPDHNYDKGFVTKAATCSEEGTKVYTCTICRESKTETIEKLPHSLDEGAVTKEPTCGEVGTKTFTCTVCGDSLAEEIAKTDDHTYTDGNCTVCGGEDPNYVSPTEPNEPGEDKEEGGFFAAIAAFFEAIFRVLFFFLYL